MRDRRLGKSRPVSLAPVNTAGWGRLARERGGSAFVEYAVLLGVFVGAGVLAYHSLGPVLRHSFGQVVAVGDTDVRPAHAGPGRSDPQPRQLPQAAPAGPRRVPPNLLTGWYAALAAGIVVWVTVHTPGRSEGAGWWARWAWTAVVR